MNNNASIYSLFLAGVFATIASSCSVAKYDQPELGMPVAYASPRAAADSTMAAKSIEIFFADTALAALIRKAIQSNFDLQLAIRRVDAYQSLAKQARAAWLPSLQLQATASTLNPSENSLNGISLSNFLGVHHVDDYALAATMAWEVDIWGKIRGRKKAALADYLQTYEAKNAIHTTLVRHVAEAYYNLLVMDAQLAVARRNVALTDSTVTIMQLQRNAGEVTSLAVEQSIAQKQTSLLLEQQLQQSIILQENALRFLLGQYPGAIVRHTTLERAIDADTAYATGIPADLLRYRPDVRAAEQGLIAANARVGVAQANLYPSLTLTATGGLNAFTASKWFTVPASLFGLAAGGLTQPLFQRRALKTQVELARNEREQNVIAFRRAVTAGVHDVTNALVKLETLRSQQRIASERVATLTTAVSHSHLLFKSGMATYLEVITAQRTALDAELERAIITRQQLGARAELYQALGGGAK